MNPTAHILDDRLMGVVIAYPNEGTYIIGANGTGKSSLLAHLILRQAKRGEGFVLIDPKRDLADLIYSLVPDAIMLDVAAANFGINLFACKDVDDPVQVSRTLNQVMQAFEKLWRTDMDATPMVSDYLSNSAMVMILTGGTLTDLERFLYDKEKAYRRRLVNQLPRRYAHIVDFWDEHEANPRLQDRTFAASTVGRRVRRFLIDPLARMIFKQPESTIDWSAVMAESETVLVRLDPQMEDLSNLVGASVLLSVMNAAYGRVRPTTDFGIYCDEYHRFGTPATADLLTQGRSFRVNVVVAHQDRSQLDLRMKGATLQAGNVFVYRVGPTDAQELGGMFAVEEEEGRVTHRISKQALAPDPFESLISRGHANEEVNTLVGRHLKPLRFASKGIADEGMIRGYDIANDPPLDTGFRIQGKDFPDHGVYYIDQWSLQQGIAKIGDYLNAVQGGRINIDGKGVLAEGEKTILFEILVLLRGYLGFAPQFERHHVPRMVGVMEYLSVELPKPTVFALGECFNRLSAPAEIYENISEGMDLVRAVRKQYWDARTGHRPPLSPPAGDHRTLMRAREEVARGFSFVLELSRIARALTREPLMVDTHQSEDIRERSQSVADRVNETVNRIANLPQGHAMVKIRTDEGFHQAEIILPRPPKAPPGARCWVSPPPDWSDDDDGVVLYADEDAGPPAGVRSLT